MNGDRGRNGDDMLMRSPVDSRADERIEGGYVSPVVSRELASLMMGCTFFARQETNGWLQQVAQEGRYIDTIADVPADLLLLLRTGSYEVDHSRNDGDEPRDDSKLNGGWGHSTTWEDLDSHPSEDDSADPFDDQTASEQNAGGGTTDVDDNEDTRSR